MEGNLDEAAVLMEDDELPVLAMSLDTEEM